ncbi:MULTISPECIES: hypothetical protein [Acetobacter]|nr:MULTISPECIES: hypothetical protein [Acetobacter]MBS0980576.1 hypothetical protein [Acetobacter thailandicus]MBS0984718.1 hypothetical protein [Acetobacter thailandicus]MBS1003763.1 hypothetical protein [Acetobacter thailandicus]
MNNDTAALNQQEQAEKNRRQKGRLKGMFIFMAVITGIMYGLTLIHL